MALSPDEIKKFSKKFSAPVLGGQDKLYSGGFFSDVLDTLSVPQYALTGALSDEYTISDAVKNKVSPSKALNLKGLPAFIVDVATDPLTYTGIGGLTKLGEAAKAGKAYKTAEGVLKILPKGVSKLPEGASLLKPAATLAGQVAQDGRSLLSFMGKPIIKGAPVFKSLTKGGNLLKSGLPGVSKALRFGAPGVGAGANLAEIEKNAQKFKTISQSAAASRAIKNSALGEGIGLGRELTKGLKKLEKRGVIPKGSSGSIVKNFVETALGKPASVNLPQKAVEFLKPFNDEIARTLNKRAALGLPALKGKVLPNVPATQSKDFFKATKNVFGSAKKNVPLDQSTKFGKYFKLGDDIVEGSKDTAQSIDGTKQFIRVGDSYYPRPEKLSFEAQNAISRLNKSSSAISTIDDAVAQLEKSGLALTGKAKEGLKGILSSPPLERIAAQADELNSALAKSGKTLRFSENPGELLAELVSRTGKSEAKAKFVENVAKVGIPVKKGLPEGFRESAIKELKGVAFPAPLVDHIDSTYKAFSNIDEVNKFIKAYDKIQGTWKGLSTFVNPAFHSRNFVSNLWQGFLGGVNNPAWYIKAGKIQKQVAKAGKLGKSLEEVLDPQTFKIWDDFVKNGAGGTGYFGIDIEKEIARNQNIAFRAGSAVGGFLEDNAKLGMFLERTAKGYSPAEAAMEVRKFFFDYSDLSDFEKNILKRVFPFYTWTRNNLPLQVAMLIQKPGKFNVIQKAKDAIESTQEDEPIDPKYLPAYLRNGFSIYFGKDPNGLHKYFSLNGFLPSVDLNNFSSPLDFVVNSTSPFIKAPFELQSNTVFFNNMPIEQYPGQMVDVAGIPMSAKSKYFASMVRPLMELDKLMQEGQTLSQVTGKGLFGAKFTLIDPNKQRNTFDYLKSMTESKIEKQVKKAKKEGNAQAVLDLMSTLKDVRKNYQLEQ